MGTLSKLAIALTVVFVVAVTALAAQLICVKWRQRRFRRRTLGTGVDRESVTSSANNDALINFYSPSKELLYFLCWRNNQSRVEPDAVRTPEAHAGPTVPEEIDDILKWHEAMYGPSRFLFTIKEDQERELCELQSADISHIDNSNDDKDENRATAPPAEEITKIKRVSLRDCLEVAEPDEADHVDVEVISVEPTPFSTPCASPPYFTPSPSPARDHHLSIDAKETDDLNFISSKREAPEFISIEIHGEEIDRE